MALTKQETSPELPKEPGAAEPAPSMTLRERLDHMAGRLSYALSLTMLASPFVLIALQPAVRPAAQHPAQSTSSNAKDQRGTAVASWSASDDKAANGAALKTRSIPVIEVKVRREEKPRSETPAADKAQPEKPAAQSAAPPALQATTPAEAAATSPPTAPASPPAPPAWSETEISAALRSCLTTLAPLAIEIEARPPIKENVCGLPAPISVRRIGGDKVEIQPAALVNCGVAAALNDWLVKVAQPAAREAFGSPIVKLTGASGYVCRNRNGAADGPISEHAFGNALDISGFVLADGRSIVVASHWGATARDAKAATAKAAGPAETAATVAPAKKTASGKNASDKQRSALGGPAPEPVQPASVAAPAVPPERTKEAAFLRRVHAGACPMFGTVLGPEANEAHRDHIHIDLKGRKRTGICE